MLTTTTTRSGRLVKKPERYEPCEKVEDDYSSEDGDEEEDDESEFSTSCDGDSDADSDGNLEGFVVPDEEEDAQYDMPPSSK
jgi:hypothetical protein